MPRMQVPTAEYAVVDTEPGDDAGALTAEQLEERLRELGADGFLVAGVVGPFVVCGKPTGVTEIELDTGGRIAIPVVKG